MKTLLKVRWLALAVAVVFVFIAGCATGGNVFNNESPAFNVAYPSGINKGVPNKNRHEVFRGAGIGGLPTFVANAYTDRASFSLEKDSSKDLFESLKTNDGGTGLGVVSDKATKLADGTPAQEVTIKWNHPLAFGLYTTAVYAKKGSNLIVVSLTTYGAVPPDMVKLLYTLKIK
jgi:hypothetical protein